MQGFGEGAGVEEGEPGGFYHVLDFVDGRVLDGGGGDVCEFEEVAVGKCGDGEDATGIENSACFVEEGG